MTMLSFGVAEDEAEDVHRWADQLGIDRSELLRTALRGQLVRLAAAVDAAGYAVQPLMGDERALADAADWGPADDWSDRADAQG